MCELSELLIREEHAQQQNSNKLFEFVLIKEDISSTRKRFLKLVFRQVQGFHSILKK